MSHPQTHRAILQQVAQRALIEKGLIPEFPHSVRAALEGITETLPPQQGEIRDMRHRLWCSIDNDASLDLDQLSVAEVLPDGATKIFVAVADVDAHVPKDSAIDKHAQQNTTSIYTPAQIFPMLPEKLSTDITSLNPGVDRHAIVIEMTIGMDGKISDSEVYRALVHNHAKLAYDAVAAWLDGKGEMPAALAAVPNLQENLLVQYGIAIKLRALRHERGALDFETIETSPIFEGDELVGLEVNKRNSSKDIIEEFMVASNGVTARFLAAKGFPSLRRVVKVPKRWEDIVKLANNYHFRLPPQPDSRALDTFLVQQKNADPVRFPDLSLSIIKLLGAGEYVVMLPGGKTDGHFGLAVKDYAHSTAPNRRYPDLILQRLLKAALVGAPVPYSNDELGELAERCTAAEDAAKKAERLTRRSAEAILLQSHIGEQYDAIVSAVADQGVWVRVVEPPVEGKLLDTNRALAMGQRLRVELVDTDPQRGFIDFRVRS